MRHDYNFVFPEHSLVCFSCVSYVRSSLFHSFKGPFLGDNAREMDDPDEFLYVWQSDEDEEDEEQQKKEKEHRGPKDRLTANYRDRVKRFFSNRRVKGSRRGNQNDSLAQMRKEDVNALCGGINMVRLDPTYYAEFYNEYREAYSFVRYLLYVTIDSGVGSCSPCLSQFPLICRCSPHLFALLFEQFGHLN